MVSLSNKHIKPTLLIVSVCMMLTACHTAVASPDTPSEVSGVSSPGFEGGSEGGFEGGSEGPAPSLPEEILPNPAPQSCPHQDWVGKPVSEIKPLLKIEKNPIRILYPDSPATMDYQPNRLNIILEKATDKITEIRCG